MDPQSPQADLVTPGADLQKGKRPHIITELALLPDNAIMNEAALANILGVSSRTIRRMVTRHELPESIRIAGRASWFAGKVVRFLLERAEEKEIQLKKRIVSLNRQRA